jgi:hypothetical protein
LDKSSRRFTVRACIDYPSTRSRDTVSESLKAIQSARAEYDLRTAFSEQERSGLAYAAAGARDYDDLAFGS